MLARRVGSDAGPFDIVVTSHLARAIETAVAMGFAVGEKWEKLGEYPETLPARIGWPASLDVIGQNVHRFPDVRDFASAQWANWKSVLTALPQEGRGLVVTHGAMIELGAIVLLNETRASLNAPAFAYCEGLRIHVEDGEVAKVELLRLADGKRQVSN